MHLIENMGYDNLVVSIKSSDVMMCVKAHELLAPQCPYPLHVGITESGTLLAGNIKIIDRTRTDLKSGDWRYDSCISYRRPGRRDQIGQADLKDTGT